MIVSVWPRGTAALLPLLLVGCVGAPDPEPAQRPVTTAPRISAAGLEAVMGRTAQALQTSFGRPVLDVREGTARKLQFSSPICVLDAYLYPQQRGGEPIVTYVDARLPDGRDMDRASCVAALNAQRQTR